MTSATQPRTTSQVRTRQAPYRAPSVGSTALLFLEPPAAPARYDDDQVVFHQEPPSYGPASGPAAATDLRMLRAAREAASGMGISDDKIRDVVENPDEVGPDERNPARMRLLGGGLEIIVGSDGMILRVLRRR